MSESGSRTPVLPDDGTGMEVENGVRHRLAIIPGGKGSGVDWLSPLKGKAILVKAKDGDIFPEFFNVRWITPRSALLIRTDDKSQESWHWVDKISFCTNFILHEVLDDDPDGLVHNGEIEENSSDNGEDK